MAYSHEENAIVERWNHEVIRYLRAMVFDKNSVESWSDLFPFAQRICNTEVIKSIGVSLAQIIAINLDRGILLPNVALAPVAESSSSSSGSSSSSSGMQIYCKNLVEAQSHAMEYARQIQKEKDD